MLKKATMLLWILLIGCSTPDQGIPNNEPPPSDLFLVVLGIAQDAGYPQAGCEKTCCQRVYSGQEQPRQVVSLGLVDQQANKVWMLEATPNFKDQLRTLMNYLPEPNADSFGGILLTHAHIGHYTGLMQLGFEVMGADKVPVYAMPEMWDFLTNNGPWSQLVTKNNIDLKMLIADSTINLSSRLTATPIIVPHRDEYSETVGFKIQTADKSVLFIPDIDKWSKWDRDIVSEVSQVDMAFVDATFYSNKELPNRNMSEIQHPFVPETAQLFASQPEGEKGKIIFIHFNHTNPLLFDEDETDEVLLMGYRVAREGQLYNLQ